MVSGSLCISLFTSLTLLASVDVKNNDPGHGTKDVTLFVGVLPQMSLRCVEVRGK